MWSFCSKFLLLQRRVEDYQEPPMPFQQVNFWKHCSPIDNSIVSIPCSTTQLCVLDIETGHIFPFCDLVALYCDSQSPDQKRNHHAQTRNHPPITVRLLSNRLLPISQLNCAPFTYWSKIKAKEFI